MKNPKHLVFKKVVNMLRTLKSEIIDLALLTAEKQLPDFYQWFNDKVTDLLIFGEQDKEFKENVFYVDAGVLPEFRWMPAEIHKKLNDLNFNRTNFGREIFYYIQCKGYLQFCELNKCECGEFVYCPTNVSPDYCKTYGLPF